MHIQKNKTKQTRKRAQIGCKLIKPNFFILDNLKMYQAETSKKTLKTWKQCKSVCVSVH